MTDKFKTSIKNTIFNLLPLDEQKFIEQKSHDLKLSLQDIKQTINIARDLRMWGEQTIIEIFPNHENKKVVMTRLKKAYDELRNKPNSYENFELKNIVKEQKYRFKTDISGTKILSAVVTNWRYLQRA